MDIDPGQLKNLHRLAMVCNRLANFSRTCQCSYDQEYINSQQNEVAIHRVYMDEVTYSDNIYTSNQGHELSSLYVTGFWKINHFVMHKINRTQYFTLLP